MAGRWKPRIRFDPEWGLERMKKIEEFVKEEFGYSDEELENLEVLDYDTLRAFYEAMVKELIGEPAWERIGDYIDIDAMIQDDIKSGYITRFEFEGDTLYLREV